MIIVRSVEYIHHDYTEISRVYTMIIVKSVEYIQ